MNKDIKKEVAMRNRHLRKENLAYGENLVAVPTDKWPVDNPWKSIAERIGLYRSRTFLAQIFSEKGNIIRISVNRTEVDVNSEGDNWTYREGITWEDLMWIKRQCGFGAMDAVELLPCDSCIVNVANMRHIWILPAPIPWKWKAKE